jgi:hypothetical protein
VIWSVVRTEVVIGWFEREARELEEIVRGEKSWLFVGWEMVAAFEILVWELS